MKHQALLSEVSQMILSGQASFQPIVAQIKKAIEELVDKEYLERVDGTTDT